MNKSLVIIITGLLLIAQSTKIIYTANQNKKIIENYCSVRYFNDVSEYKKCKASKTSDLIIKLTNEEKEKLKEIQLPEVKI